MPRIDVWLVEQGLFKSRQAAKRAIRNGYVKVNGVIAKPSTKISGNESVEVSDDAKDVPLGYTKLRQINHHLHNRLIQSGMRALDIGSSVGGFLKYLLEKDVIVTGIEISDEFIQELEHLVEEYDTLSLIIDDAFLLEPSELFEKEDFDLLLIDVTTDPDGTISLAEKYSLFVKKGGYMLLAIKSQEDDLERKTIDHVLQELGFSELQVIQLDDSKKEIHIVALR